MNIQFKWIGSGCFTMLIDNSFRIACDPCLGIQRVDQQTGSDKTPVFQKEEFTAVDLWLITDSHRGHPVDEGLKIINERSEVVCPKNVYEQLTGKSSLKNLKMLKWREEYDIFKSGLSISVKAIKARHNAHSVFSFLSESANGYWLKIHSQGQTRTIYITGDTVWDESIRKAIGNKLCDVLIPEMGLTETKMTQTTAIDKKAFKKMTKAFEPLVILPLPYDAFPYVEKLKEIGDIRLKHLPQGKTFEFNI